MSTAVGKWYTRALYDIVDQTLNLTSDTLKLVPIGTGYVFDPDHTAFDDGTNSSTDLSFNEITCTNYTPGYGSSSRKTATLTKQVNNTDNRLDIAIADITWSALGGTAGGDTTIGCFVLVKPGASSDATTRPIAYFERKDGSGNKVNVATNGSDVTVDFETLGNGGNLRLSV